MGIFDSDAGVEGEIKEHSIRTSFRTSFFYFFFPFFDFRFSFGLSWAFFCCSLKWYSYSGHSEKRVIGTSFKEVPHGPETKALFKTIQD
jgi:hypothetical protein